MAGIQETCMIQAILSPACLFTCIHECMCELFCAPLHARIHVHPSLGCGVSVQNEPNTGRCPEALRTRGAQLSCLGSVLVKDR